MTFTRLATPRTTLIVLIGFALNAHAQTMKAGLWDTSGKVSSDTGEIEKAMAQSLKSLDKLPKEQREALKAQMARSGMQVDGTRTLIKLCVPKGTAIDKDFLPTEGAKDSQGCTSANVTRDGNLIRSSFFCSEGDVNGERLVELSSNGISVVRHVMTTHVPTTFQGRPVMVTSVGESKFVSSNCGAIKPLPSSALKEPAGSGLAK